MQNDLFLEGGDSHDEEGRQGRQEGQVAQTVPAGSLAVTTDPFLITGPAVLSVSGGRTSAYMLWRVLQAHGGRLPDDVLVCFCNTGREMPATLDFVHRCSVEWGVTIHWLEYRHEPGKNWTEEVSHNSASRNGEPFRTLLDAKKYLLPNMQMRYCTEELKVNTLKRWLKDQGFKKWANVVGLRADEKKRVEKRKADNARGKNPWTSLMPLAEAGVTKRDVLAFFAKNSFDLQLREWEGNCDFCFAKRTHQIARMFEEHPERGEAWIADEAKSAAKGYNGRYRSVALADLAAMTRDQVRLPVDETEGLEDECREECGI